MTGYKDIAIMEADGDDAFDALMNNEKQINSHYQSKNMEKKSVVKAVTFQKEFDGKFGKLYYFNIEMENGDKGQYGSKTNPQTKFKEGEETAYDYIDKGNGYFDIKTIVTNTASSGGFQRKPFDAEADKFKQVLILAQSSMSKVVDMANHKIIEYKDLQAACDKLMQQQLDLAHKYKDYTPL